MIFGKKQTLVMIKRVEFGIYLAETMKDAENKVLLPKKQVPADMEVGDPIDVFLYKDSNDRPIATVKEPKLTLGQTARLRKGRSLSGLGAGKGSVSAVQRADHTGKSWRRSDRCPVSG